MLFSFFSAMFQSYVLLQSSSKTVKVKIEPLPSLLLTFIVPPNYSQIRLQIFKPSPTPDVFKLATDPNLPKTLNRSFWFSIEIPIPESLTSIVSNFFPL